MILKSITFSDASTTDNDVLESVQVRIRGRERIFLYELVERDDWDHLVSISHAPGIRREIREMLADSALDFDSGLISLTAEQALFLATVTSGQSQRSIEAIWPGRHVDNDSVYDCLVFGVFNRLWEHGVDGAGDEVFA